ncbi:uncharacterized protein TNIN_383431 [Trichonephila inaurata madagascariensis]|uniref:Uncharacterized protein n=1 Tax=Trichonephila inaurata madagascariensis TaxID=2747483 RepID=A0A8X6WY55_9ARAC|nr:uncharacterized protein TNIN_383431 [Trichonephila inaurata madagascariensis]
MGKVAYLGKGRVFEGLGHRRRYGSGTRGSRKSPVKVVDDDKFQHGGVDEKHAHAVPQIHGGQVGDHWQSGTKTIRRSAKVQHGRHTNHHSGWHSIDVQPEADEGARH